MSRHKLEDGKTPDPKITNDSYDVWLKIFSPPPKLVGDYYKRGLSWEKFEKQYIEFLQKPIMAKKVEELARTGLEHVITLLCVEPTAEKCHRRLLAEECQKYYSELVVEHR